MEKPLGFKRLWKDAALVTEELLVWLVGLFMVPRLKDRLLTTVRGFSTGLGLELRLMREWYAAELRLLLLLLLKAGEGDWLPPPLPSWPLLWLRKKWGDEGETGEETEEAEEKDGMSSTSSMSKDLFSAAGAKKEDVNKRTILF